MSILIAEDDPVSRRLLEKVVQGLGHEVTSVEDGQKAWEYFETGKFNFVITDWVMPRMDGLELCRKIRSAMLPNYVYIIMVTSGSGQEDWITGMGAGADEFITKPVNARELQVRMRAAERMLKLQTELRDRNLQLEEMNVRLRRLSRLDSLMQIGNRLAFEERIMEFHHRATRYGSKYGVVMCDVDRFKDYNDHFGHLAGDEVLRRVSGAVSSCLRLSDGAFRYGGEEIVVVLAEQSLDGTALMAERLRATVEALQLPRSDLRPGACLTISCGVAACPVNGRPVPAWETVLEWADQALYRAKAAGRNWVELSEACVQHSGF